MAPVEGRQALPESQLISLIGAQLNPSAHIYAEGRVLDERQVGEFAVIGDVDAIADFQKRSQGVFLLHTLLFYLSSIPRGRDSDYISFRKGHWHLLSQTPDSEANDIVRYIAKQTFGTELAEEIWEKNHLHNQIITYGLLKKILVAFASSINLDTLRYFYQSVHDGEKENLSLLFPQHVIEQIEGASRFEALHPTIVGEMMQVLLSCPYQSWIHPVHTLMGNPKMPVFWWREEFAMAATLSKVMRPLGLPITDYPVQRVSEYLSKILAYGNLNVGRVIPLPYSERRNFSIQEMVVKGAVIAYFLVDIQDPSQVHVVFRGTQPQFARTNAADSILADIDPRGIGHVSFDAALKELMKALARLLQEEVDYEIRIHGHSLGGVYSQRFLDAFLDYYEQHLLFRRVKQIAICGHNSPGVEKVLNDQFLAKLSSMVQLPKVSIEYVQFYGDPIQRAGEVLLGYGLPLDSPVEVNVWKIASTMGTLSHGEHHFMDEEKRLRIPSLQIDGKLFPKELFIKEQGNAFVRWLCQQGYPLIQGTVGFVRRAIPQRNPQLQIEEVEEQSDEPFIIRTDDAPPAQMPKVVTQNLFQRFFAFFLFMFRYCMQLLHLA